MGQKKGVRSMKRLTAALLCMSLFLFCAGCEAALPADADCQTVAAVYEKAGCEILHVADEDRDYECYIRATDPQSGDYVFFYFFADEQAAQTYADSRQWNVLLWFLSFVMFEPTWLHTKVFGNVVCEYDNDVLFQPFQSLLN